jgi:hypothetical protein
MKAKTKGAKPEPKRTKRGYFVLIFLGVVVLWITCWALLVNHPYFYGGLRWEQRGQFGDMFGVLNALFSGLAFAGIIVTILLQSEELSLQRVELAETRAEFTQQNKTLKRQRFESSFLNMVSIHFNILSELTYYEAKGVLAYNRFVNDFIKAYQKFEDKIKTKEDFKKSFDTANQIYLIAFEAHLGSLYQIYRTIKDAKLQPNAERRYFNLLASYISMPERRLLSYLIILKEDRRFMELDYDLKILKELHSMNFHDPKLTLFHDFQL